ncbi:hypothetical protein KC19_9G167400 [Ceratodon purpureus]|uniref:Uncharacterized protein n=1 Tax=Ceratodon purpureus TaxID=3225 RepID=A0A8T0GUP1_CERPU|nr:hypothetical protein KC19_9G167400 [Ceratodon purpureus]
MATVELSTAITEVEVKEANAYKDAIVELKAITEVEGKETKAYKDAIVKQNDLKKWEPPVDQFTLIKNVSLIEKNPVYSVALKEWDRTRARFEEKVDRREKNITDLKNHVFNIVGFFSVFQGVVLTTVTQLNSDKYDTCGIIWFPIALSTVAALGSAYAVWHKFSNLRAMEDFVRSDRQSRQAVENWAQKLRESGKENFFFYKDTEDPKELPSATFYWNRFGVIVGLFFFTILFVLSYLAILCDFLDILNLKGGFGAVRF